MDNNKMEIKLFGSEDMKKNESTEHFIPDRSSLIDMGPTLKNLCHINVGHRGGKAFKTKDGCVILYHIATYDRVRGLYWYGICLDNFIKYTEKMYPNNESFVAFQLRIEKDAFTHAVLVIPTHVFIEWYEDIAPDDIDNKWHVLIYENSDGTYKIRIKDRYVDMTEYLLRPDVPEQLSIAKTDIRILENIELNMSSCIENTKKVKSLISQIEMRKNNMIVLQDKIDSLKKELDIERTVTEDGERKLNICKQDIEKNEKQIYDIIKTYIQEQANR